MSLLVSAGWALVGEPSEGRVERDVALLVDDGTIVEIGPDAVLQERHRDVPREGGTGLLALPGLVNAHHHGRGVTWLQQGHADEPLESWLLAFRLAATPDPELDARYAAERLLRSGVTTVMLSHYLPATGELADSAFATLRGLLSTGLRVVFAVGFMDRSTWNDPEFRACFPAQLEAELSEHIGPVGQAAWPTLAFELFDTLRETALGEKRLVAALGPVAPQWCSDDLLREIANRSRESGAPLHMHALETQHQARLAQARHAKSELARVAELGVLSPRTSVAHAVWMSSRDIAVMTATGATVVHNASSNMRLGSGRLPLAHLLDIGLNVALGTDCAGVRDDDDMLHELGLAAIAQRAPDRRWLAPHEAIALATTGGARAAGLAGSLGALDIGRRADILLLDLEALAAPAPTDWATPLDLVLGRATTQYVRTVLVDGEVVVRDGSTTRTDAAETSARLGESLRNMSPAGGDAVLTGHLKSSIQAYAEQVRDAAERRQVRV